MLDFPDLPYRYFPPRSSPLAGALIRWVNRWHHLPRKLQITRLTLRHAERLARLRPQDALLLVPNHPTHADAAILVEACRRLGLRPRIMAAYDVFLRRRIDAWVMQRLGCFSVNRDASDPQALAEAERSLTAAPRKLVIFPEGNVYLRNDRVGTFQEGAALLALRSARALQKQAEATGRPARRVVVPMAIQVSYATDIRSIFRSILTELAQALSVTPPAEASPADAVRQLALAALHRNLAQRGLDQPESSQLPLLIQNAAEAVLGPLEAQLDLQPRPKDSIEDRVRAARRAVHAVRSDSARIIDHAAATIWADQAMLALRIASYAPDYVAERPTCDRVAQTIEKLWEDLHRRPLPPLGPRNAWLAVGEPIPLDATFLDPQIRTRAAVTELTGAIETTIQQELDGLGEEIRTPGRELWGERF